MSIHFDGATTPWKSANPSTLVPGGWLETFYADASEYSTQILEEFNVLKDGAEEIAEEAQKFIKDCTEFTVSEQQIEYTNPIFNGPVLTSLNPTTNFNVALNVNTPSLEEAPAFTVNDSWVQVAPNNAIPPVIDPPLPVPLETTVARLPIYARDTYNLDPGAPPSIVPVDSLTPAWPIAPTFDDSSLPDAPTFITPEPYTVPDGLTEGLEEIEEAIRVLQETVVLLPTAGSYSSVFTGIMECVGNLLNDFPFTQEVLTHAITRETQMAFEFGARIQSLWPGQNLPSETAAGQSVWLGLEDSRFTRDRQIRRNAAAARAANDAHVIAFELGAAAHRLQMDILLGNARAEMEALAGEAEALLDWYRAADLAYKGSLALFEANALVLESTYSEERMRVQEYESQSMEQISKGDLNVATGRIFETQERLKGVELAAVKAEFERERIKLRGFDASKTAERAETDQMRIKLEAFKAKLLEWSGGLTELTSKYQTWAANARATQAVNQAHVSEVRAKAAEYAGDEAAMESERGLLVAATTKQQLELAQAGLPYLEQRLANQVEGVKDRQTAALYGVDLAQKSASMLLQSGLSEGYNAYNLQLTSYLRNVADVSYRAASQTQSINDKLVDAYTKAQIASGDAQAALEAGKWSKWNLTASVRALGNVAGYDNANTSLSTQRGNQISQTQRVTTS